MLDLKKLTNSLKPTESSNRDDYKTKEVILNEDQTLGLKELETWLYAPILVKDESLFAKLTGSAGTGKTTLLGIFLSNIIKYRREGNPYLIKEEGKIHKILQEQKVCICAPTHKAKKVVKAKTNWNNSETLQALLGLKPDLNIEEFDVNNPIFNPIGDRKIKDYELVVIDEASMVNTDLYTTICDCAKACGTKVLFVGDPKQLNPVKEYTVSMCLISPQNGYHLTQIVRQSNTNPLLFLLDTIREDLDNGTTKYINYMMQNPVQYNDKGEGYECVISKVFAEKLKDEFTSSQFALDKDHCRYVSWTNESITRTSEYIREKIFNYKEALREGELMLAYKTVLEGEKSLNPSLINSDDYLINKITEDEDENGIKSWIANITCIDTDKQSTICILKPEKNNYERYIECHEELLSTALSTRRKHDWKRFYELRDGYASLHTLTKKCEFTNKDKLVDKRGIYYGYGITIHKSQGSTYNTVLVNGKDINQNPNDTEKLRLWYVALSRASHKAIINL